MTKHLFAYVLALLLAAGTSLQLQYSSDVAEAAVPPAAHVPNPNVFMPHLWDQSPTTKPENCVPWNQCGCGFIIGLCPPVMPSGEPFL